MKASNLKHSRCFYYSPLIMFTLFRTSVDSLNHTIGCGCSLLSEKLCSVLCQYIILWVSNNFPKWSTFVMHQILRLRCLATQSLRFQQFPFPSVDFCGHIKMCAGHLSKHKHIFIRFFKIQSTALCARITSETHVQNLFGSVVNVSIWNKVVNSCKCVKRFFSKSYRNGGTG